MIKDIVEMVALIGNMDFCSGLKRKVDELPIERSSKMKTLIENITVRLDRRWI